MQNAAICIFDMTGKTIKKLPVSSGMESVSIGGYELGEGSGSRGRFFWSFLEYQILAVWEYVSIFARGSEGQVFDPAFNKR